MGSEQPETFEALERREWGNDRVARSYAERFGEAATQVAPVLAHAVGASSGTRALDLCCGHGNVSAALRRAGAAVTGLDFSPAMLDLARAAVPDARFLEGDAGDLPFDDGTFDAVTIGFGMPHVPDPPRVLAEARRVLGPGGRLAFSVWCGPEVAGAFGIVFGAIAALGAKGIALPPGPGANDYADPDIAFPALVAAGFGSFAQETVASGWTLDDPGAPYDMFRDGTARGGALLRVQPDANARAIREAVAEAIRARYGDGPVWQVPIPSVVTSATAV